MQTFQLGSRDMIVVQPRRVVCIMVLQQGNAMSEESRLTGQVSCSHLALVTHPNQPMRVWIANI